MKELSLIFEFIRDNETADAKQHAIEELINNHEISEIMVNSYDQVFYEIDNKMFLKENVFKNKQDYHDYIESMLRENNIRVNESRPIVDFNIGNDLRINLIKESISHDDIVLSVRKKRQKFLKTNELVNSGFCTKKIIDFIIEQVDLKKNIFISGETSTGKTTLLNALLKTIDPKERMIIIEDTQEIQMPKEYNAINLISRSQLYESREISISDLIKTSLRMRPDRIILGEIRREEVIQFIHALNTGHSGSICTGHGNSAYEMYQRLLMLLLESNIPMQAAEIQLGMSIQLMVHLSRRNGIRRIQSIYYVKRKQNKTQHHKIVEFNYDRGIYEWTNN